MQWPLVAYVPHVVYRGKDRPPLSFGTAAKTCAEGGGSSLISSVTSCFALSVVAACVVAAHRVQSARLELLDSRIARCVAALDGDESASGVAGRDGEEEKEEVRILEWTEEDAPDARFGSLVAKACADPEGIATRSVANVGVGVVACDRRARRAAVLVVRHPNAEGLPDASLRNRLIGRERRSSSTPESSS